jgi:hypothetical protein
LFLPILGLGGAVPANEPPLNDPQWPNQHTLPNQPLPNNQPPGPPNSQNYPNAQDRQLGMANGMGNGMPNAANTASEISEYPQGAFDHGPQGMAGNAGFLNPNQLNQNNGGGPGLNNLPFPDEYIPNEYSKHYINWGDPNAERKPIQIIQQ